MNPSIHVRFAYDAARQRIIAQDDRESLPQATSNTVLKWLMAVALRVPSTPEVLEMDETVIEQGGIVLPRPMHRVTRYLARPVDSELTLPDTHKEKIRFLLGCTHDMSVQVISPRLHLDSGCVIPWNPQDAVPGPMKSGGEA